MKHVACAVLLGSAPNPFVDYRLTVTFAHESGAPAYHVPGYFAADGNAANSGAASGNKWRAHFAPDRTGRWDWSVSFVTGKGAAIDGMRGTLQIAPSDKSGADFRGRGRLQYVGRRYLRFAGSGEYFLKAGTDSPETLLAYADFDGTRTMKTSGRAFVGKDGLHLLFKLQETENDDHARGSGDSRKSVPVAEALDAGDLGPERKLYLRELIARFGYLLALNWNLGEENTQTPEQQRAMAAFIRNTDPYGHHIVIHTYPNEQEKVYLPLLGAQSVLTGASLQNSYDTVHARTVQWIVASERAGKPWVVANDEQGTANLGVPPDPGFAGWKGVDEKGSPVRTIHDIRKYTLWGNLMAGGVGVEYYFGYLAPHSDLDLEDFRSRGRSWEYARIALEFFRRHKLPFWEMEPADALVGNSKLDNSRYCLARPGRLYLVYLPNGGSADLDLSGASGAFSVNWFDPRSGGTLTPGSVRTVKGGGRASLGAPPESPAEDWLIVVRRTS